MKKGSCCTNCLVQQLPFSASSFAKVVEHSPNIINKTKIKEKILTLSFLINNIPFLKIVNDS